MPPMHSENSKHFHVYWQNTPRQLFAFLADIHAAGPVQARQEFQRLFPRDFVIGAKEAAAWDGCTLQGDGLRAPGGCRTSCGCHR